MQAWPPLIWVRQVEIGFKLLVYFYSLNFILHACFVSFVYEVGTSKFKFCSQLLVMLCLQPIIYSLLVIFSYSSIIICRFVTSKVQLTVRILEL